MGITKHQCRDMLYRFSAAWPRFSATEAAVDVWHGTIGHHDLDTARQAASTLLAESEFPPSPAKFNDVARGVVRRRMQEHSGAAELGSGGGSVTDRATAAEAMRALTVLAQQFQRPDHDHRRGIENCPSCEGREQRAIGYGEAAADLLADYGITIDRDSAVRYTLKGQPGG